MPSSGLRGRGINYDTGFGGGSRPEFVRQVVERELQIIADDLHCSAVRVSGGYPERIAVAGRAALEHGLELWYAPFPADLTTAELLPYLVGCAERAEELRRDAPETVLVLGCELTLFQHGFMPGHTFIERIVNGIGPFPAPGDRFFSFDDPPAVNRRLNDLLGEVVAAVRRVFRGRLTYASGKWEDVDWSLFDIVSVDLYRQTANAHDYVDQLRSYFRWGKPVAVTEFGCCTFRGASELGGIGWTILDIGAEPARLVGDGYVRDEAEQASLARELLGLYAREGVDSAFWFTFVQDGMFRREQPEFDLDLAAYAVVSSLESENGATYTDMRWEPKESFQALAETYAKLRKED